MVLNLLSGKSGLVIMIFDLTLNVHKLVLLLPELDGCYIHDNFFINRGGLLEELDEFVH